GDEVDRGILGEPALLEDGVEVLALIFRVEKVVMSELVVNSIGPEMNDEAGAGRSKFLQRLHEGGRLAEELPVGGEDLHVADDVVGRKGLAVPEGDASDFASLFV